MEIIFEILKHNIYKNKRHFGSKETQRLQEAAKDIPTSLSLKQTASMAFYFDLFVQKKVACQKLHLLFNNFLNITGLYFMTEFYGNICKP